MKILTDINLSQNKIKNNYSLDLEGLEALFNATNAGLLSLILEKN